MIDLRNIAQRLRLPADQLRIAADLLEQGYQPAFIARYRADEAGHLPGSVLWSLKFAMEREHQLDTARREAVAHLGEGVELDDEGRERVERSHTILDIDVALRCFRSRRAARQSGERSGQASQLLEKMIAVTAPVADMSAWVAEQLAVEPSQSDALAQQCSRLIATLLAGDTRLMERMRHMIQKKAAVRVEAQTEAAAKSSKPDREGGVATGADGANTGPADSGSSDAHDHDSSADGNADAWAHADDDLVGDHGEGGSHDETHEEPHAIESTVDAINNSGQTASEPSAPSSTPTQAGDSTAPSPADTDSGAGAMAGNSASSQTGSGPATSSDAVQETTDQSGQSTGSEPPISLTFEAPGKKAREGRLAGSKRKDREKLSAKALAKLTPRQRRRRWLNSVLQPFKSLKKPLSRLTAYQMLMLGRGQRSQLIRVDLDYDRRALINMARDVFVSDSHPLAKWFAEACEHALAGGLYAKVEADALAEEDELAQQKLLEAATDQLRVSLLQRPVKGHRILVVDTVGPNSSCIAIIDARGKCLATQEVVCSSQPSVVSQNVIMLGELVHKHKVTLVALSNGPARRFLVHTVAELMKQSASGNLRWTMVDRGGAEAYATSRQASVELPQLNRRFRAAVWLGRRLQDPLGELLKLDTSRLRLGSYQRELPQDPLKRLVTATLSDCLCVKGVDARYASEQQFNYVPGVSAEIASRLADMASKREFVSREAMLSVISDWPETGRRQALGFLRIYQSPQTLDGTLIHPDDYRLAQRLIENTELVQPAAAPEGWLPPKIKAPKPPRGGYASAREGKPGEPTESSETTAAPTAEGSSEPMGSQDASGDVGASVDTNSVAAASPESTAATGAAHPVSTPTEVTAATSGEAGTEAEASFESENNSENSGETSTASTDITAHGDESPASDSGPEIAPEYSEDVVIQQAAPPAIDVEKLARGWQVGRAKLSWLANCLGQPFGDSRDKRPPVPMLASVPTLADLKPGMSVYAIVVGVAEFGAFVELGPDCGGLIHISRLSARYVEDPHQAVQIGDLVQTWVVSVDVEKKRVALTALSPQQQERQAEAQRAQEQARAGEGRGPRGGYQGGQQGGGQRQSGQGQGTHQQSSGNRPGQGQDRGRPGGGGGRPGGGQGGPGGPRRDRAGAPTGGRSRGARRDGGGSGEGGSRPVVVKSKKPSKPITEAMKKGQEPLRSFSDLLQFYEVQRTDAPAAPVVIEPNAQNTPPAAPPDVTPEPQSE